MGETAKDWEKYYPELLRVPLEHTEPHFCASLFQSQPEAIQGTAYSKDWLKTAFTKVHSGFAKLRDNPWAFSPAQARPQRDNVLPSSW